MKASPRPWATTAAAVAIFAGFFGVVCFLGVAHFDTTSRWYEKSDRRKLPRKPARPASGPTPGGGASVLMLRRNTSCALMHDGSVWCWGAPWEEPRRPDLPTRERPGSDYPTRARAPGDRRAFAFGGAGVCEIDSRRTAFCQPPQGDRGSVSDTALVAIGDEHGCLVRRGGELWCWGRNTFGQLFGAATGDSRQPSLRLEASFGVTHVAVSPGITCVTRDSGEIRCQGGFSANVGATAGPHATIPAKPDAVRNLVAGDRNACVLRASGAVECWSISESGSGSALAWGAPRRVLLPDRATAIAASLWRTCARLANATILCWDRDLHDFTDSTNGGGPGPSAFVPTAVELAISDSHGCLANAAGDVQCWGNNEHKQVSAYTQLFLGGEEPGGHPSWSEAPTVPIAAPVSWPPAGLPPNER